MTGCLLPALFAAHQGLGASVHFDAPRCPEPRGPARVGQGAVVRATGESGGYRKFYGSVVGCKHLGRNAAHRV